MERNTLAVLGAAAVIGISTLMVAVGRGPYGLSEFVKSYQTLIAGTAALIAAWWTISWDRRKEDDRIARENYSARAVLPLALAAVTEYARKCSWLLLPLLVQASQSPNGGVDVAEDLSIPSIPDAAIPTIRDAVRLSDKGRARQIANLLAHLQVQNSRLNSLGGYERYVVSHTIQSHILDAAELYAMATRFFDYGRRSEEGDWRSDTSRDEIERALRNLYIFADLHPDLEELIDRRWPQRDG
jgi:hypothetical protein